MESEGRLDHPYVAHYDEPDEPDEPAAASSVGLALGTSGSFLSASDWPYLAAVPLIVLASLLESLRIRRLRARWQQ